MPRLLVIEDDPHVRELMRHALQSMDYDVEVAENGEKGLKAFEASIFDLVITDLVMPFKDGVETILELKFKSPEMKVIAISGDEKNIDIMETTYKIGVDAALTKPISTQELGVCVARVLAGKNPF